MPKIDLYSAWIKKYKSDKKNEKTPYKVVASGILEPQRFESEQQALRFFNEHQGRALLSFNTNHGVRILKYKFS